MAEEEVTEPENPAEEKPADEVVSDGKETEVTEAPEEETKDKPKKPWYQKRIDRFTAQNQALARTNEQLISELANLKSGKTEEGGKSNLSDPEIQRAIENKAAEIVEIREFNAKCNAVYEDGNEEYEDFQDALKELGDAKMMTKPFLDIITDLDEGHKILYYLGKNPEEAERINSLSQVKQALALKDIEDKLEKPKEKPKTKEKAISDAPPPIKTVESKSGRTSAGWASKYYEGMSQEEFNDWDDKQSRKRG